MSLATLYKLRFFNGFMLICATLHRVFRRLFPRRGARVVANVLEKNSPTAGRNNRRLFLPDRKRGRPARRVAISRLRDESYINRRPTFASVCTLNERVAMHDNRFMNDPEGVSDTICAQSTDKPSLVILILFERKREENCHRKSHKIY